MKIGCTTTPSSGARAVGGIRMRTAATLFGRPLVAIAIGPDFSRGEMRGHAHGVVAIGDMATGFIALGGLARGVFALGGCAIGCVALGGLSIGLLAIGGAALGAMAFGGAAAGVVAVGGGAAGFYACGGSACGSHVVSAMHQDPEAVEFFRLFKPGH